MLVEVSGQRFTFPPVCACCGHDSDSTLRAAHSKSKGKRVVHTKTWSWDFPYCKACLSHVSAWNSALGFGFLWAVVVAFVSGILFSALRWDAGFLVAIILGGIGWGVATSKFRGRARLQCSAECACAPRAVEYVNWYGSAHSFEFRSRSYAGRFMLANRGKLINVTREGEALLDWAISAFGGTQHAIATDDSLSIRVTLKDGVDDESADDVRLIQSIAKIESLKGPGSRRAALDVALKHLSTNEARTRLQVEAARIEVRSALEKVDSLKTKAAKDRVLCEALIEIQSRGLDAHTLQNCLSSLSAALSQQ